jgi:hypothetical protein
LRASSQSTRASDLYQRVFDHLARGELAPTVFRDLLPGFLQGRGPAYTSRMADVSSRFFSALVEINAAASHALADLMRPEDGEPALGAPPEFDSSDPIRWYQQLVEYAGELNARAVQDHQVLLERVAQGEISPAQVRDASSAYLQQRLPEQINELGALFFELLNGLNDLRVEYEEDFLSGVLASATTPGQASPPALDVVAPLGGSVSTSLQLTNTRSRAALVHCHVTDVRRADGVGPAFSPRVLVAPDGLEIPPGGEGTLVLSWHLDDADWEPEVLYTGSVRIEREGEPRLEIPLRMRATPAAPATKRKAAKSGGTAKRKPTQRKAAKSGGTAKRKPTQRKATKGKPTRRPS